MSIYGMLTIFFPFSFQNPGSEFIFPEGAGQRRGRFELAFSQIGGSVLAGKFSIDYLHLLTKY